MSRTPRSAVACTLVAAALLLSTPSARSAGGPDPAEIVAAERDFAASVRALGVRDGFLAWLAPSSVVFKPGPVMGVAHHQKLAPGWNGLLAWAPVRAAISTDGRLGWSTGPWTWRRDSTQQKPDAQGEYMSLWRRQPDGRWKVVLDGGVGHGPPSVAEPELSFAPTAAAARLGSRPLAARKSLYEADASFARTASLEGIAGALRKFSAEDVVVLREGSPRLMGRAKAVPTIAASDVRAQLVSNAQFISDSGDLGYTYGSLVTGPEAAPDSAWYVHVWQRSAAAPWQLAAQLVMPVTKKK